MNFSAPCPLLLALLAQILARRGAHPHQIARRLMHRAGNPYSLQLARPQQPRQADRIAPVRLDALTRTFGDQRGRNDIAALTELDDLAVEPIAGRPDLIAEMQARMLFLQLAHEALDRRRPRLDLAEIPDLPIAATLGKRNGVLGRHRRKKRYLASWPVLSFAWGSARALPEQPPCA